LSAGGSHTCAIAADGSAYCWGSNADLQVGNKETERACGYQLTRCFTTPQRLAGARRYVAIAASDAPLGSGTPLGGHTCALTAEGRVFCWGLNEAGQLGGGSQLRSAIPLELHIEETLSSISAGRFNTCGVTDSRSVVCWNFGSPLETWKVPVS
jgi:alpha-tubulin suppressor-like RCC1 family protein